MYNVSLLCACSNTAVLLEVEKDNNVAIITSVTVVGTVLITIFIITIISVALLVLRAKSTWKHDLELDEQQLIDTGEDKDADPDGPIQITEEDEKLFEESPKTTEIVDEPGETVG